jgi:hypothetical protein
MRNIEVKMGRALPGVTSECSLFYSDPNHRITDEQIHAVANDSMPGWAVLSIETVEASAIQDSDRVPGLMTESEQKKYERDKAEAARLKAEQDANKPKMSNPTNPKKNW